MSNEHKYREQNTIFLTGWIVEHDFRLERVPHLSQQETFVLEMTLRTDHHHLGGHHRVLMYDKGAVRTKACLDVMAAQGRKRGLIVPSVTVVDQYTASQLSELFLEVTVDGWVRGNDLVMNNARYLNLSNQMRRLAKEHMPAVREQVRRKANVSPASAAATSHTGRRALK